MHVMVVLLQCHIFGDLASCSAFTFSVQMHLLFLAKWREDVQFLYLDNC